MMKNMALALLALLTISCAVLEGLIEGLPPQFVQLVGLLTILSTGIFVGWTLRLRANRYSQD